MDIKEAVNILNDFYNGKMDRDKLENDNVGSYKLGFRYKNFELDIAIKTILAELEKKDTEIIALQMEHEHDLKMIDEVKGEAVKLYNEIEQLKIAGNGMDLLLKQQTDETQQVLNDYQELGKDYHKLELELENKDTIINTMQAEFERLEDLEDNTDMLKMELEKKDKIINFMAEWFEEWAEFIDKENYYTIFRKMSKEDIKEYFKKKVED